MKKLVILFTSLAIITTSCGKKMDEAKIFINEVHLKMAEGDYDFIYDSLSGKQITDYSSKQELSNFFANFLDSADIIEVKKKVWLQYKYQKWYF